MALLSASHSPGVCRAGLNTSPQELTPSEQAEGSEGPPLALLGSPQYLRLPASSRQPVPASWRVGWGCSHFAEPISKHLAGHSARNTPTPPGPACANAGGCGAVPTPAWPCPSALRADSVPAVTVRAGLDSGHRHLFPPPRGPRSLRSGPLPTPCPRILGSSSPPGEPSR